MIDRQEFEISVMGSTDDESEIFTKELEAVLLGSSPDVNVVRIKTNQLKMDLGATIGIVVASAAATALANGVADWLRMRNNARLRIRDKRRNLEVDGLSGKDITRVLKILTGKK
jgi:hypothetical protein